jgi:peptide/nickel transport system permease protein
MDVQRTDPKVAVIEPKSPAKTIQKSENPWAILLRDLFHHRSAVLGMIIIGLLALIAIFANVIATHDPLQSMIGMPGETPPLPRKAPCIPAFGCTEPMHLMGLDLNARDVFSRLIYGARVSLPIGIISLGIAAVTGSLIGVVSGYAGGWADNMIMRIMDVLLAFPSLLLAIAIVTIRGPSLENALIAISIVSIPGYARLARSSVLSVKEQEFVTAERALGANHGRIIFAHILPNSLAPLIVQAALGVGGAVLSASALSFLGLGAQPPIAEWGAMLAESRAYVFTAPHLVLFPGMAIMITVLGFNLLGDGLRDVLDPRLRGR